MIRQEVQRRLEEEHPSLMQDRAGLIEAAQDLLGLILVDLQGFLPLATARLWLVARRLRRSAVLGAKIIK